jgi:hypothetical protein
MKGGGQYTSASSYGEYVLGSTNDQYNRVFGPEYANVPGNVIIGAQSQNLPPMSQIPTPAQLSLAQSGGTRNDLYTEPFNRLTGAVKELAEALNQPVFPFAYLNKTIKQQENENSGGRRRRTRRHRKR